MNKLDIAWSPDFEIGIDIIDEQHKRLFDYFTEIEQVISTGNVDTLKIVVKGLIDYAISHNSFEETLMKDAGYPMLEAHHSVHEEFKKRMHSYEARMKGGEDTIKLAREVRLDIAMWLMNHIKREDKHYAPYVKKKLNQGFVKTMLGKFFG